MSHLCALPSFPCLCPLGLNQSSPRMAGSPSTSAHPVYNLQKTVFWPFFFFLFVLKTHCRKLPLNLSPLSGGIPSTQLCQLIKKCLPPDDTFLVCHPWRQSGMLEPQPPLCPRKGIPSEWETTKDLQPSFVILVSGPIGPRLKIMMTVERQPSSVTTVEFPA